MSGSESEKSETGVPERSPDGPTQPESAAPPPETPDAVPARGMFAVPFGEIRPFVAYAWHRFGQDRCTTMASSLSYTSLLAIVPLTAIAFAMLAAFPVFGGVREEFQSMVFANLLPQSAESMQDGAESAPKR